MRTRSGNKEIGVNRKERGLVKLKAIRILKIAIFLIRQYVEMIIAVNKGYIKNLKYFLELLKADSTTDTEEITNKEQLKIYKKTIKKQ